MGTLVGHIAPALVLVMVGVWHLVSIFACYVKSPREYVARAWHPANWLPHRGKHVELYVLVLFIPVAIFYELGVSTNFQPLVDGAIPKNRVSSFEHTTTLIMFWMYAVIVLVSDTTAALPLPSEASLLFASIAFGLEWISVSNQAARNSGLESQCNLLLAYVAALCAICTGLLALRPKLFLVDLVLCMGIILQGTWLFQIGLYLYVEKFIPEGCHYRLDLPTGIDGSTQCDIEVSRVRAVALVNLAFNFHVIMVVLFSVLVFAAVAKVYGTRRGYDSLSRDITDGEGVKPVPKLHIERP
ncbi:hypothetical protein M758_4G267900 [Ceratodon purpureus]|uniref:Uncharacterized protein n=1 Tax=Ceratodon purpureus TaxID=3225 RepID=A0A8T0IFU6_CERPU|nr:hypothetical protein KC19_4G249000 [Ceratodon purpureus]KAG0581408.1 hypothetical protein KC19_4G249200 [Ceratodon purpureus]KAG0621085.1 hypothetical protein M758_4G267700 [Ceratodon purpureus]KAG0621087.1 hypothetical protein M758_4G267900 [Ceratodon purpureus]